MTYLDHLNDASEALQAALDTAPMQEDRDDLQRALDQVNRLIAGEESIQRRLRDESRSA